MWVTTKDGRQVNTDWFDKERQIATNKQEADERNGKSGAGSYTVYRAGDLSGASTGMVYFAMSREVAEKYAKPSSFKMQGKTYKTSLRQVNEYKLDLKNPLVVEGDDDMAAALSAYNQLYPDRKIEHSRDRKLIQYAKKDGFKVTGLNSMMLYLDTMNGRKLAEAGYDSIQYKTFNSKSHKRELSQIILLASAEQLKKG